jgi:multidrug transporter EmrE-like cation transporter
MKEPWIALIAVVCNVAAQLSMKYAGQEQHIGKTLASWLSPWLLSAVVLYGLSFLLTVRVFAVNPLSVASPAMAGCTFLLIALASWSLLGEGLGYQKLAGIGLIFIGIAVLTRG